MKSSISSAFSAVIAIACCMTACAQNPPAPSESIFAEPAAVPATEAPVTPPDVIIPTPTTADPLNVTLGRGALTFHMRTGRERPSLIVTQPISAEAEAQWKEDLRVMEKLLSDQITPAVSGYPQAMGIKLTSFGQTDPMYIEDFGTLFTYRVGLPLAKSDGTGTTQRAASAPSAWDKAKRELSDRGQARGDYGTLALVKEVARPPFDQADLDKLIAAVVKILPEATNIRNLPADQNVVVTLVGGDDAGTPMRLTIKAKKNVLDEAAKAKIPVDDLLRRIEWQIR